MEKSEENNFDLVYHTLKDIGCCQMCCLRFIGEKTSYSYLNVEEIIKKREIILNEKAITGNKIQKDNACAACLGLIQKPYCDIIVERVLKDLEEADYDCDTFNIALTLPVSFQLRAHSMFLYLQSKYPKFSNFHFPLGVVTVGVKDVWKWVFTPVIAKLQNKKFSTSSDLTITVALKYADEEKECISLFSMFPDKFSRTKNRKNQGSFDNFSRKSAETSLKIVDSDKFSECYAVPPVIPDSNIVYDSITMLHSSVYIAGRYNKLSRVLPQTPWLINGERKLEGSVEELISGPMKRIIKSQDTRFAASGREDVDVRTLGRGRPFYVEHIDPHRVQIDFGTMRQLEDDINKEANGEVFVRDLQFIDKSALEMLKVGEETKTKEYRALCFLLDPKERDNCNNRLKDLSSQFPVKLQQATPIRVLHRRPVAVRERTIHWLKTTLLREDKDVFTISLNTQAGTYIKEFIHGDFGRTKPCLGELLGGIDVDILALDVEDVLLDWPPEVSSKKEQLSES
ncbi:unnamed protein product [Nezara viridula]|uniref:tRNA pseudouridine(55) synthase n=1 Tax=Nezara viridula TaxID=85310 RepID=A0A9P0HCM6_NEZVI|nr:unnamed protein product [Nezara viridula]